MLRRPSCEVLLFVGLILFSNCSLWAGHKPEVDFKAVCNNADLIMVGRVNSVVTTDKIVHRSDDLGKEYETGVVRAEVIVEQFIKGEINEKEIVIEFPNCLKVRMVGSTVNWHQGLWFETLNPGERAVLLMCTNDQQTGVYSFANEYRSAIPIADSLDVTQQLQNLQPGKPEQQIASLLAVSLNSYSNYVPVDTALSDLVNLQGEQARPTIKALLDHWKEPDIRALALTTLISGGDDSRLAEAVAFLSSGPETDRLMNEKKLLSSQMMLVTNVELIVKYYIPLMRHPYDFVRRSAAYAIRCAKLRSAVPQMVEGLTDTDLVTRYNCLMGLSAIIGGPGPSLELFKQNEQQYIEPCQEWWRTKGQLQFMGPLGPKTAPVE